MEKLEGEKCRKDLKPKAQRSTAQILETWNVIC